eukprot:1176012-Prorocentrum_minimum.AAC.4
MKRHWVNLQREFISIQLNHKHILKTHGFFFLPNRVYFVLDYAKGGDLYQSLKREGPYTEERTFMLQKGTPVGVVYRAQGPALGSWEDLPPAAYHGACIRGEERTLPMLLNA